MDIERGENPVSAVMASYKLGNCETVQMLKNIKFVIYTYPKGLAYLEERWTCITKVVGKSSVKHPWWYLEAKDGGAGGLAWYTVLVE